MNKSILSVRPGTTITNDGRGFSGTVVAVRAQGRYAYVTFSGSDHERRYLRSQIVAL